MNLWRVYLLKCADGTHYCGATSDITRRVKEHNDGKGARYTSGRRPVKLIAKSKTMQRGEALSLEAKVKKQKGIKSKTAMVISGGI